MKFDVCVIGSGAGAGPIIYELSKAGKKVVVLEKGPWIKTEDFTKDEMTATRRDAYQPHPGAEPQVKEYPTSSGFKSKTGMDFQNGLRGLAVNPACAQSPHVPSSS